MKKLVLTEQMIERAYQDDESIRKLVGISLLRLFEGSTFSRTNNGWSGDGGFYGPSTALGKVLELAVSSIQEQKNDSPNYAAYQAAKDRGIFASLPDLSWIGFRDGREVARGEWSAVFMAIRQQTPYQVEDQTALLVKKVGNQEELHWLFRETPTR